MDKQESQVYNEIPNRVRVLGKIFKIVRLKDEDNPDCDGLMEYATQTISIRDQPGIAYCQDTLLHETIHAIDETLFLRMSERQVSQLASVLLGVLKDNPKFTEWLLKPEV